LQVTFDLKELPDRMARALSTARLRGASAVPTTRTAALLEAPVLSALLRLAAPNIVVVAVQAASSTVDAFYLSRLGPSALAGVALVFPGWMLMVTMAAGGIGIGVSSAIARALGAGRRREAASLAGHSLLIAPVMAALFAASLLLGGPALYRALGGQGAALEAAVAYSNIIFAGAVSVWLLNIAASILRGGGEMLIPAIVVVFGELLHVALAPALIFGLGPVPALGVTGGAFSLLAVSTLRALALCAYLLSGRSGVPVALRHLRLRPGAFAEILRVGLPASANTLLTNLNVVAVTGLVGAFGTAALAGYGLAARLEYLLIPLVFGLGTAIVTLVGTSVGAGRVQRARRVAWTGGATAALTTGAVGLVVGLHPDLWLGIFTSEPSVLEAGATYLHVVGPAYLLTGLGLALYFALQGAGRPLWPLATAGLRLAVAAGGGWLAVHVLAGGLGALAVAVALGLAASTAGLVVATSRALRPGPG
jgi:putative MATE family efflux protein